ncbi:MAG: helix-turn-helix transcriptional regulator [Roseivirga sp.]|nr:helix-turn-helix transcriptional regulator [Roseivirga sp.]
MNKQEEKYFQKLGARIKQLREERGLDQKAFAFDCEIGRTQLYMIENGKTNPRLLTLMRIAKGLEVTVSDLLEGLN